MLHTIHTIYLDFFHYSFKSKLSFKTTFPVGYGRYNIHYTDQIQNSSRPSRRCIFSNLFPVVKGKGETEKKENYCE